MAGQPQKNVPQMPVSGKQIYGNATGQPAENGKITYGTDLRTGKGK